jgi:very-short-patch-repair endonuclease
MYQVRKTITARSFRKRQTYTENILWNLLRARSLGGYKFYRQFPIGPFIVDFCCRRKRIIIELDGLHHRHNREADAERTAYFSDSGFKVLRFLNKDILNRREETLMLIKTALDQTGLSNPLSLGRGPRSLG